MAVFEVTVVKWVDDEGIEKREIAHMTIREDSPGGFRFDVSEGSHPLVPMPLRYRGTLSGYANRQSVWALVIEAIRSAIASRLLH